MWPFKANQSARRHTIAARFGLANSFSSKSGTDPVSQLVAEIVDAGCVCAANFRDYLDDSPDERARVTVEFALATEFAAAFTCLALRLAMIQEHHDALRTKVLFLFPDEVVATFTARESVYAECREIFVPDQLFSGDGVVNKLAGYVAEMLGKRYNPEIFRQAVEVFARVSAELPVRDLVIATI